MNRLLNKRLIKLIILLMVISTSVHATSEHIETNDLENTNIKPYFTNISVFVNTFEISTSGKASVSSYLTARNIDSLKIEVSLQQFNNGQWTSIKTWTETLSGMNGGLSGSYYVPKGNIYRVVSKGMVYENGLLVESTRNISEIESY